MKTGIIIGLFLLTQPLFAQDLSVNAGDVEVEAREDGFHLTIRNKPGISSVLLTDTFELPDHSLSSYALRGFSKNEVNGNETRLLDGKPLKNTTYSLIDSTVEPHPAWKEGAYRILIPPKVQFGYPDFPNSRFGTVDLQNLSAQPDQKFWFSIRAFEKSYADYTGKYTDNAFELFSYLRDVVQLPPPPDDGLYQPKLETTFEAVSNRVVKATGPEDMVAQIEKILEETSGESLDLVLVVDTTKSMVEEMNLIKSSLLNPIKKQVEKFKTWRLGYVFYRDYMEEYLNRVIDFQSDFGALQRDLNRISASGGGDVPEAVYEALNAGLTSFRWEAEKRLMILVGDAPAHEVPRGRITKLMVDEGLMNKKVEVVSIMIPYSGP